MILIKIAVVVYEIKSICMRHTCKFSPTYGKSTLGVIPCCLRRVAFPIPANGTKYFTFFTRTKGNLRSH